MSDGGDAGLDSSTTDGSTPEPARPATTGSWCSPAACRTSATCRCAPGAGSPRRCARPAPRSTCATWTPTCSGCCGTDAPDCVLPLLHGETGEDGAVREVLELVGLPYVGSPPVGLPRGVRQAGRQGRRGPGRHATPRPSVALPHETFRELGAAAVMHAIVAIGRAAADREAGPRRVGAGLHGGPRGRRARRRDGQRLRLRRHRAGRAASSSAPRSPCPSSTPATAPAPCPVVSIEPDGGVYDYAARYTAGSTEFRVPAKLPTSCAAECARVAVAAHEALGLRDLSRSDLIDRRRRHRLVPRGERRAGPHRDLDRAAVGRRPRGWTWATWSPIWYEQQSNVTDRADRRGPPCATSPTRRSSSRPSSASRRSGCASRCTGTEHVPRDGGALLALNHVSYVDFILGGFAAQVSKRLVRFMAKRELFDHRWTGPLMRSLHHISVDRGRRARVVRRGRATSCARGEVVGIFPEATISRSFELKEFKTGATRMAAEAGVPLVPVVLWGTQRLKTKAHPQDFSRGKTIAITRRRAAAPDRCEPGRRDRRAQVRDDPAARRDDPRPIRPRSSRPARGGCPRRTAAARRPWRRPPRSTPRRSASGPGPGPPSARPSEKSATGICPGGPGQQERTRTVGGDRRPAVGQHGAGDRGPDLASAPVRRARPAASPPGSRPPPACRPPSARRSSGSPAARPARRPPRSTAPGAWSTSTSTEALTRPISRPGVCFCSSVLNATKISGMPPPSTATVTSSCQVCRGDDDPEQADRGDQQPDHDGGRLPEPRRTTRLGDQARPRPRPRPARSAAGPTNDTGCPKASTTA